MNATNTDVSGPTYAPTLGKLTANILDSVSIFGPDGRPLWSSQEHRSALGYSREFWHHSDLDDLLHPDDRRWVEAKRTQVFNTPGSTIRGQARIRRPDDTYGHVLFSATNHVDDPEIGGVVLTVRPIDEDVRDRTDRTDRERDRRDAAAAHSDVLVHLSNEVRSPVQTILGTTELLERAGDLTPLQRDRVATIALEADGLRAMVDDLLDLSKISAGQMELSNEVFSPASVVDEIGKRFADETAAKGLDFGIRVDAGISSTAKGDARRLHQILVNLVSNAVDYTPSGFVRIEVTENPDQSIRFRISDSGPGIAADVRTSMFDPFVRGNPSETRPGTGLGLTIAKRLVELMDGSLGFETSGRGTSIWCDISFGHARRASDVEPTPAPVVVSAPAPAHVLIVDDSEVNRLLASSQLDRLGYTSLTVNSGEQALVHMATHHFDAVLMDWHMPGLDGLEATRQWRSTEQDGRALPIITMTASAMTGDRERCLAAGASDYLSKPVSITDLGAVLAKWTRPPQEPQETAATISYDLRQIETLIEDLGDVDVVCSILDAFLDMVPQYRKAAEDGLREGDHRSVRRCAHTLKPTATMLGAKALAEACSTLEQSTLDRRADLRPLVDEFDRCCEEAEVDLAGLARSLKTGTAP